MNMLVIKTQSSSSNEKIEQSICLHFLTPRPGPDPTYLGQNGSLVPSKRQYLGPQGHIGLLTGFIRSTFGPWADPKFLQAGGSRRPNR